MASATELPVERSGPLPAGGDAAAANFRWVPIRSLGQRHRPGMRAHLLALDPRDRYLRFGFAASDAQIEDYVARIDFAHSEVFGVFNRRLELIALAHLAYEAPSTGLRDTGRAAEFGVSVLPKVRGRGFGARLFEHAALHARNHGVNMLVIHALSENAAMLRIARKAGAVVEREGAEAQAMLRLPPEDVKSRVDAMVEGPAAEIDYQIKRQARRLDHIRELFSEVKVNMGRAGPAAVE
jgi:GNAT superfamily N-acetyltransferase